MHLLRRRLRAFTWLALVAICALALAPAVSRSLDAEPWVPICSTADGGGAPVLPGTLLHAEHCPLCGQGAGPLGLPPASASVLAVPVERARATRPPGEPQARGASRFAPPPRGPPSFA